MLSVKRLATCSTRGGSQEMYITFASAMRIRQNPLWLWNPEETSPENPKQRYKWPQNRTCECVRKKNFKKWIQVTNSIWITTIACISNLLYPLKSNQFQSLHHHMFLSLRFYSTIFNKREYFLSWIPELSVYVWFHTCSRSDQICDKVHNTFSSAVWISSSG